MIFFRKCVYPAGPEKERPGILKLPGIWVRSSVQYVQLFLHVTYMQTLPHMHLSKTPTCFERF